MNQHSRTPLIAAGLGSLGILVLAVIWIVAPETNLHATPSGSLLDHLLAAQVIAWIAAALGVAGSALSVIALLVPSARAALGPVAVGVAAAIAVATPGSAVQASGYAFALLLPVGVIVAIAIAAPRRPLLAAVAAVVAAALAVAAFVVLDAPALIASLAATMPDEGVRYLAVLAHLVAASGLVLWVAARSMDARGPVARLVLRQRVAITIAAALCAAPYVIARATWLTPWPLFGGSVGWFAEHPEIQLLGLMLGSAMLAGGILTLGLVLPWGERFPRWMSRIGGRSVPALLAIVPASAVAVLFTVGGLEFIALALDPSQGISPIDGLAMSLVVPFWLWGPLLGLATWGYAMHRRDASAEPAVAATRVSA